MTAVHRLPATLGEGTGAPPDAEEAHGGARPSCPGSSQGAAWPTSIVRLVRIAGVNQCRDREGRDACGHPNGRRSPLRKADLWYRIPVDRYACSHGASAQPANLLAKSLGAEKSRFRYRFAVLLVSTSSPVPATMELGR